jgi:hypothetical protein
MKNLNEYDWHCDNCNSYLNDQPGFNADCGTWYCTYCDYSNSIDSDNIIDLNEYSKFENSDYFGSYNEYKNHDYNDDEYVIEVDSNEDLSVDDAALIWLSNGKDEDYTFGYTEDELEDALK